ncbi:MAG: tRNA 2-thiouridine(34) synthase MnmA [Halieaceae bacterium]|jgi:tRNA-specific 2-thiouridylase|nr:tRNA 2-thiouridine(34) synthase MnmA [Halieaceae bacterium]
MSNPSPSTVIVGMSGGVDSSVAALLLRDQGYRVEGLFMKNWDEDDGTDYCTAKEDLADAEAVAASLGIKLHSANFAAEYWDGVFEHFLAEYQSGRTPNPDILCNREIKFRAFLDYATELGADFIATGHYVRRDESGERTALLKGLDPDKDQSYFLHQVGHRELSRSLFPVGDLAKPEVRKIAEQAGLTTARKKDSTGICFIGERRFKDFLQQYLPAQPGVIEDINGQALGEHQGLMYHTIGQRQGLGIGGLADRNAAPWYVVEKHVERNVLIVAQGNDHPRLYKHSLHASTLFWISEQAPAFPLQCTAKVRYRQPDQNCVVTKTASGFLVEFDVPQRAITPGQSVVFYHNDTCMGGGIIEGAL